MHPKHLIVFLLPVLFALPGYGQVSAPELDTKRLEQKVDRFVRTYQPAPDSGISVAVIKDGKIAFFKGYGFANRTRQSAVTSRTIFNIGSSSKSFTAMAIAMLHDQGLSLNTPVREMFPDFAMYDPQATAQINLTDMLSHRSGLPRHDLVWEVTPFSREEIYHHLRYLHPNHSPEMGFRGKFQYNNLMYISAGQMLERLTHESWEQFVRERIFAPLGMKDSGFAALPPAVADWASPYQGKAELNYHNLTSVGPAGSIRSNAEDLAKWVSFLLNDGVSPDGSRLVSQESLNLLFQPQTDPSGLLPGGLLAGSEYGMGWFLSQIDGEQVIWHPGNVPGYTAHVSFMPKQKLGVVILVNQGDAAMFEFPIAATAAHVQALPYLIYDEVLRHEPMQAVATAPKVASPGGLSGLAAGLKSQLSCLFKGFGEAGSGGLVGSYQNPGYGLLKVEKRWPNYVLDYYGLKLPLCATSDPDVFTTTGLGSGEIRVTRDAGGVRSVSVPFEQQTDPVEFRRNSTGLDSSKF